MSDSKTSNKIQNGEQTLYEAASSAESVEVGSVINGDDNMFILDLDFL
jgi:hypothetical protein